MLRKLLSIGACICLMIAFVAAGLGVCAGIPQVTRALAEANSNDGISPYSHDELVTLACETRDFTVSDYGRSSLGEQGAEEMLMQRISDVAGRPYDPSDSRRFLDEGSIAHLNDVNAVIAAAFWPLLLIAVAAAALLICGFALYGKRFGGNILLASGIVTLAFMIVLAANALISFDSFFSVFHSLFFAKGTWTFAYDSLLICMYPIGFWIGMAALWASTTAALSVAAIIIGAILRRAPTPQKKSTQNRAPDQEVIGL